MEKKQLQQNMALKLNKLLNVLKFLGHDVYSFLLKQDLWFVGGAVRDSFLDKEKIFDLDIVTDEPKSFIKALSKLTKISVITLDEDFGVYRIYFPESEMYLDVSKLQGKDIYEDLSRRDFTINAIAVRFFNDNVVIQDPFNGINDIHRRVIRTIDKKNIIEDPLRLLRAFRLHCELGFEVEQNTLNIMKNLRFLIKKPASERIKVELLRIFNSSSTTQCIRMMCDMGIFQEIFSEFNVYIGFYPGKRHKYDLLNHSLKTLEIIENYAINNKWPINFDIKMLNEEVEKDAKYLTILKIAALFHDIGKLFTSMEKDGKTTYYSHDVYGSKYIDELFKHRKFSKYTINILEKLIRYHMYPFYLIHRANEISLTPRVYLKLKRELDDYVPLLFILSIADTLATNDDDESIFMVKSIVSLYDDYVCYENKMNKKKPLLNGKEIMEILKISEGPKIGQIISRLEEAELSGLISTKEEAISFLRTNYEV